MMKVARKLFDRSPREILQSVGRMIQVARIEIGHGAELRDKCVLLIRWLLVPVYVLVHGRFPKAEFYPFDVLIKTDDGAVFCARRGTGDVFALLHEEMPYGQRYRIPRELFAISGGVFVDVGANLGKYTVMVARHLLDRGSVVAIEPNREAFQRLIENVRRNSLTNVVALNIAADAENGRAKLVYHPLYLGNSYINKSVEDPVENPNKRESLAGTVSEDVDARKLDDVIAGLNLEAKIRLIKIDVEGWECQVVRGLRKVILEHRPIIIFEAWSEQYLHRMQRELNPLSYSVGPLTERNFLATPILTN